MTRPIPFWTAIRIEQMKVLIAEKKTTGEISKEMGTSRNSIIGKARRMGIELQTQGAALARHYKTFKDLPSVSVAALSMKVHTAHPDRSDILRGVKIEIPRSSSTSSRDAVLGLGPRNCRFPSGDPRLSDFSFCMKPSPIYGYCSEHRELAYQVTRPRVR